MNSGSWSAGEAYQVVRYHSLLVDWPSLPACLEPIAWTAGCHHALHLAGQVGMTHAHVCQLLALPARHCQVI